MPDLVFTVDIITTRLAAGAGGIDFDPLTTICCQQFLKLDTSAIHTHLLHTHKHTQAHARTHTYARKHIQIEQCSVMFKFFSQATFAYVHSVLFVCPWSEYIERTGHRQSIKRKERGFLNVAEKKIYLYKRR